MKIEYHLEAFDERKETIFKWALDVRGLERSKRIIGDNASRAIIELLAVYLHKKGKVDEGFNLNHRWFKSEKVKDRLPEFENKGAIVKKMVELENACEKLSYGSPKGADAERPISLFLELEKTIRSML